MKRFSQSGSSNFCPELRKNALLISQSHFSNFALHVIIKKIDSALHEYMNMDPSIIDGIYTTPLTALEHLIKRILFSVKIISANRRAVQYLKFLAASLLELCSYESEKTKSYLLLT